MKKLFALFLVLACAPAMFAVGSVTCTVAAIGNTNIYALTWAWIADASAATVPADTCAALNANSGLVGYHVLSFTIVPGSPAPTNLYSATIKDGNGVDQLGAQGAAALLTATPQSFGVTAGANAPLNGTLTLAVTGNAVNSAKGTVIVYLGPQEIVASKVTSSGGGGAPTGAAGGDLAGTYPNPTVAKLNGTALSGLATGILKNTTTTGVPSIAAAGTDYVVPGGALGTPSSGILTNATGLPSTSLTGDVSIANLGGSYIAGGGTANAQTLTLAPAPASLAALVGKQICWLPTATSTSSVVTLAVNGLTATAVKRFNGVSAAAAVLALGDIQNIVIACAIYDGTQFQLLNPQVGGPNQQPGNGSSAITALFARNAGTGGITLNLSTPASGGLFPGIMNSAGSDWGNGLARAGFIEAQSALQFGAGNSNITHTIFTNGNEQIHTGAPSDAGGSQRFQVIGGIGATGEIVRGTRFTCTSDGCTPTAGGATGGEFTVTTTGAAAPVITMGDTFTAPTGYNCTVSNKTTANLIRLTASTTTTATFGGVTVAGDTISFRCTGY